MILKKNSQRYFSSKIPQKNFVFRIQEKRNLIYTPKIKFCSEISYNNDNNKVSGHIRLELL